MARRVGAWVGTIIGCPLLHRSKRPEIAEIYWVGRGGAEGIRTSDLRGAGRRQTFSTGFSVGGGLRRIRRTDSGPPDIGTVRLSDGSAALWVLT
jgi:hypothetical protein